MNNRQLPTANCPQILGDFETTPWVLQDGKYRAHLMHCAAAQLINHQYEELDGHVQDHEVGLLQLHCTATLSMVFGMWGMAAHHAHG